MSLPQRIAEVIQVGGGSQEGAVRPDCRPSAGSIRSAAFGA